MSRSSHDRLSASTALAFWSGTKDKNRGSLMFQLVVCLGQVPLIANPVEHCQKGPLCLHHLIVTKKLQVFHNVTG